MWNKDTIHWLPGPVTVDLGRWGRKHENMCWFRLPQCRQLCLGVFKNRVLGKLFALCNSPLLTLSVSEVSEKAPMHKMSFPDAGDGLVCAWHKLICVSADLATVLRDPEVCSRLTSPAQLVPHTLWSFVYRGSSSLNAQLGPAESPCLLFTLDWLTMKCNVGPSARSYSSTATLCEPRGECVI